MPIYEITDPNSGRVIELEGDTEPTEAIIQEAFTSAGDNTDFDIHTLTETYADKPEEIPSIDERIEKRGTAFFKERIDKLKESTGVVTPTLRALGVASIPQERTEAAIANALLAVQSGKFDDVVSEFQKGAKGEKLGEVGDIFRNSNIKFLKSEPVAATAGMILSIISPMSIVAKANKALKGLYLKTDKNMLKAGSDLIKGADDATSVIGRNVDRAYEPFNDTYVDGMKLINSFDKTPKVVVRHIEDELGTTIDSIAQKATIADVRKIKGILGKLKPSSFGKSDRGAIGSIEDSKINTTYANVKNMIQDSLSSIGFKDGAKNLLDADEAFTETANAARFIKKSVMDSTLRKPTHGGRVAKGLVNENDVSTRVALTTLRNAGGSAKKSINSAISALERYNRHLAITGFMRTAGKAALFGGAVGAVGGKVAQTIIPRN